MTAALETMTLPSHARYVLDVLDDAGYESWCVGGFVRDALIGHAAYDVDVATSATWTEVRDLFAQTGCPVIETGTKHGTVTVRVDRKNVEVTTFRTDGAYCDGRHPSSVSFVRSIEEDLARRDFTMNAIAYHPARGMLDPFGGASAVASRRICAVGDPDRRFQEDSLRILRGIRFASQLGFTVEQRTKEAMVRQASAMRTLSGERIAHELEGILCGQHVRRVLLEFANVLATVVPEIAAMEGFRQQHPFHTLDVLEHTAAVVQGTNPEPAVRWAAFFHDAGKPATFTVDAAGVGHFHGHAAESARIARSTLARLHCPTKLTDDVITLVSLHDAPLAATPVGAKKMLRRLDGREDLFRWLCDLKRSDVRAQNPAYCLERIEQIDRLEQALQTVLDSNAAFSLKDLAVNGHDVIDWGVPAGPLVGQALEFALDEVIAERARNERAALKKAVLEKFF